VIRIRTLLFDAGFSIYNGTIPGPEKISFQICKFGKSRGVLRLYVVKGVVSLNTIVKAGYKYPVFNLVVVAQCKTRNMRKRAELGDFPTFLLAPFPYVPPF
jgi:hypothetical protein